MQKTIFVVDDNDTNLTMAKNALKDDYRVMTLPSAAKMFALMEKVTPDLILLDIDMPEVNGFEAMKRLKSSKLYSEIPVIFLSAMSDAADKAHGIELGAVDFITKPFSEQELLNRVKNHIVDGPVRERPERL